MGPVLRHMSILLMGLGSMICMLQVKCKYFKLVTPFILLISGIMLLWVLFAGHSTNGAARWISFIGIQFQPSEIAKGAVVLAVAQILSATQTKDGADKKAFKFVLWICIPYALAICLENLSTAMLLCLTVLCMMIIGQVSMRQIGKLVGIVSLIIIIIFAGIMIFGQDKEIEAQKMGNSLTEKTVQASEEEPGIIKKIFHRADTWKGRIDKWLDHKPVPPEDVDLDKDAQVAHANIAIASSNIIGKGPGNSVERDFLSQAFSDFIYAIIIEELGITGAIIVALLYIFLLFRTGQIANRCENTFPAFLAMGLAILLVTQALFNMLVAVGIAPVTGQPLPLISRGGTSTIINCLYVGIILSISRTAKKKETPQKGENLNKLASE